MSVPKSEADQCIEALDEDKDEKIGFGMFNVLIYIYTNIIYLNSIKLNS